MQTSSVTLVVISFSSLVLESLKTMGGDVVLLFFLNILAAYIMLYD